MIFSLLLLLSTLDETIAKEIGQANADAVFARFTADMAKAVPKEKNAAFLSDMKKGLGALVSVVRERRDRRGAQFVYELRFERGASLLTLSLQGEKIAGFLLAPLPKEAPVTLSLPFSGEWTAWNTALVRGDPHFGNENQQFAVDWVIEQEGRTFTGNGERNEDYHCYGKDMLAPADGVVVYLVDGVPENAPKREQDVYNVGGNQLMLDLGQGVYAYFAHAIPGSFKVKPGDKVKRGQRLARIGNSGNSTEPHLHFQLADQPKLFAARSLPAKYANVRVNGVEVARAWPAEGDRVAPQ